MAAHDIYFFEFMLELNRSPKHVGEVIVSRSGAKSRLISHFDRKLSDLIVHEKVSFPVRVLHTKQKLLAGENRNRAWDKAQYEYTAFCDADDSYSPYRLSMLSEAITLFNPDLLVHDYFAGERHVDYEYESAENLEYVHTPDLHSATFLDEPRIRSDEGRIAGDTNIRVPLGLNNHVKIHHAHACVRTELRSFFQFSTTFRSEDGQFCRDILESRRRVVYIPWELSTWKHNRSSVSKGKLHSPRKVLNSFRNAVSS